MPLYWIDPCKDPRWETFLQRHPAASVFHARAWLAALQRTYGFEPVVLTTTPPGSALVDGIALCRITSRITGDRLVSLPCSDHCEPLADSADGLTRLLGSLTTNIDFTRWKYLELRPLTSEHIPRTRFGATQHFLLHRLDLRPDLDTLFGNLHKNSIRRPMARARRDHLRLERGRSSALLDDFYHLTLLTRRRHQLPPQPIAWFRNLVDTLKNSLELRVAYKDATPIASILTITHKDSIVYKYSCSDRRFSRLGGTQLLLWNAIVQAKQEGLTTLDMGRSDREDLGLIKFKERWGSSASALTYLRLPPGSNSFLSKSFMGRMCKSAVSSLPLRAQALGSRVLYKHLA